MTKTKILCTLGPSSLDPQIIKRLDALGVWLFRINLSHTKLNALESLVKTIQSLSNTPICLDTEGAQIRTGDFADSYIQLRDNTLVTIPKKLVPGDPTTFNFTPLSIIDDIHIGDFISIDFNAVLAQVIDRTSRKIIIRILNGGKVGRNKAVTVERNIKLPALTQKDVAAIEIGKKLGLKHFALSFANKESDVDYLRELTGEDAKIISKIESLSGLDNLRGIIEASDCILIDRGDLSRQVPLEKIPQTQKWIIKTARDMRSEVFVATNLLESMVSNTVPTRAEINDIYNTLLDGANGLVLAAETAIGLHPIQCVSMVSKIINDFETTIKDHPLKIRTPASSLLTTPHGGLLINQYMSNDELHRARELKQIVVANSSLLDLEQIAHGTFSPVKGFMDKETLECVLDKNTLPCGSIWTMPILLQLNNNQSDDVEVGEEIALADRTGVIHGTLNISDKFSFNLEQLASRWFSTKSKQHPGVSKLLQRGNVCVGGEIKYARRPELTRQTYQLTPAETRFIFNHKGWSQVIGFHTRNPVHRGHEYIQKKALEISGADGLFINPVIGPKKKGDFKAEYIMKSYQTMLEFGLYPKGKVILGGFSTYARYAGPREAIFTALCRKNMGCSHFIIGRDHTGIGHFYANDALEKLLANIGNIGIELIFFSPIGYLPETNNYGEKTANAAYCPIDGTTIRNALRERKKVSDWMMHELVQDSLLEMVPPDETMFVP